MPELSFYAQISLRIAVYYCIIMSPTVGKGAISFDFARASVYPSVCLSVAYIANNSRTQRLSVSKFERKVPLPHLRCDSLTSFKVERSKVGVTMSINADIMHHIFRMARPTNFKLGKRMQDDDPHQPRAA